MNVAMVSAWDTNIQAVADLTIPNRQEYCKRHGYTCITSTRIYPRPAVWWRYMLAQEWLSSFDWLCVADVDLLIMNYTIRLESFLGTSADLLSSYDVNGLNIGVTFLRNTAWMRNFLARLLQDGPRFFGHHSSHEQTAMAYLLYKEQKDRWEVVPQRRFNSFLYENYPEYDYKEGQYQPGDFALHLPALPNARRIEVFKHYLGCVNR